MNNLVIKTLVVGQLQTNCYLLINKETNKALIIDPGDSSDYITSILQDEKTIPVKILATHGHFDHILAAYELQLNYQITFMVHQKDVFLVKEIRKRSQFYFPEAIAIPPKINNYLKHDQIINLGKYQIQVIETPGHTPGSVSLYIKEQNILFTGDTLFANGGVGRTDFSYSSVGDLNKSLAKIYKLPGKTIIYPGHGSFSSIEKEKKSFIRQ